MKEDQVKNLKAKAIKLLHQFKGNRYVFGTSCLEKTGKIAASLGSKALLITNLHQRSPNEYEKIHTSLACSEIKVIGPIPSVRPNAPVEDVLKLKEAILSAEPDCILTVSGGSGIDASKAGIALAVLNGDIEDYFGTGKVSEKLETSGKKLLPHLALQTAASSASHLTKYSNITDLQTFQKKLIVDNAIIPRWAIFDYSLTKSMSAAFTADGALDGISHCLEVYLGAGRESFQKIQEIALTGIELILASLERALADPSDMEAREALGLATDLGGYAIMTGGTNGAHLTSFSMVDILSHGRACALMNPYFMVFFAPAVQKQLKKLAMLFSRYSLLPEREAHFQGKELGVATAQALLKFIHRAGVPTALKEIKGFNDLHITKVLRAAKNPQLEMKLRNMPVPLRAEMVDEYMKPVLDAARSGDFKLIKLVGE